MDRFLNPSGVSRTMMIFCVTVFSLILVISTCLPLSAAETEDIEETSANRSDARTEAPTLEPGSSWTYTQERMVQMTPFFSTAQPREYVEMEEEVTYTVEGIEELERNGETHTVYEISIDGEIVGGEGQIDLEITSIDIEIDSGYVEGHRYMRVSDLAVVEEYQFRDLEGVGILEDLPIARADVEIELERNEEYSPPVEIYNFPINAGERFTTDHQLRNWGSREMEIEDVGDYEIPDIDMDYDNEVDFVGDTEITGKEDVGDFDAYHMRHIVDDGDYGEINRWYGPDVNFHVKEEVELGYTEWTRELIEYDLEDTNNQLSLDPFEADIGEKVTLNGQFFDGPNEPVVIRIPTGAEPVNEWTVTTDDAGNFEKEITVPAAYDHIVAQDRFSSVGFVANIEGQIAEFAVSTLVIHHDNSPVSPEPEDGAEDVFIAPELKVFIAHEEHRDVDVTFYEGDDEKIGTHEDVASGEYAMVTWELFEVGTFTWYAVADDGVDTYTSEEWSLTTSGPFFEVSIEEPRSREEFIEEDLVEVEYSVENIGDEEDTQDIEFKVHDEDGRAVHSETYENLQLQPDQIHSDSFVWTTEEGDSGSYELLVLSEDYLEVGLEEMVDVTVLEPAFFDVDIIDHEEEVVGGDTLELDYEVTNTGEAVDEQEIIFKIDGDEVETRSVELAGGETVDQVFTWEAEQYRDYDLSIQSENDRDEVTVTVLEPAFFEIVITEYETEIVKGDTVVIGFEVTNEGEAPDTKEIELKVDGEKEDTKNMSVHGGNTQEDEFEWTVKTSGDFELEVSTEDSSDHVGISVLEASFFEIDMIDYEEEMVEGDTVELEYEVTNVGEALGEREIRLFVDGNKQDGETVSLDGGETHEGELIWIPDWEGDYELEFKVLTEDDEVENSVSHDVSVLHPPYFEIEITEYDEEVYEEETIVVQYTVRNEDGAGDTQEIEIKINGQVKHSEELELNKGEEYQGEFEWEAGEDGVGEFDLTVSSEDHEDSVTLTVEEDTPGFTFVLLILAGILTVAIYQLKNKCQR